MHNKIIKNNLFDIVITSILIILSALSLVAGGYSMSTLLNFKNVNELFIIGVKVLIVWLLAILLMYISNINKEKTMVKIRNNLRIELSRNLIKMDYELYYSKDTGNYISWFTNDVNEISLKAFENIFVFIENLAMGIFSFLALIYFNFYIGIMAIILLVCISIIPNLLSEKIKEANILLTKRQEKFIEKLKDILMGYNVYNIFNVKDLIVEEIEHISNKLELSQYNFKKKINILNAISMALSLIAQIVLLTGTAYLSALGLCPIGAVLSTANLGQSFFQSISNFIKSAINIKAIKNLYDKYIVLESFKKKISLKSVESIDIENLSYSYGDKNILENINLSFIKGNKYGLIGKSGSGKSSLLKLLLGLHSNYEGSIKINNLELRNIDIESLYNNIIYIEQNTYLFNNTVRENISMGEEYTDEEIISALEKAKIADFVLNLSDGLDTMIEENGKNLSGGQRQRFALARGFIRNSSFIIIDEGTSAVDRETAEIIELDLLNNKKLSLILISHNLSKKVLEKLDKIYSL